MFSRLEVAGVSSAGRCGFRGAQTSLAVSSRGYLHPLLQLYVEHVGTRETPVLRDRGPETSRAEPGRADRRPPPQAGVVVRGRSGCAVRGSPAGRAGQGFGEEGGRLVRAFARRTHPAVSERP